MISHFVVGCHALTNQGVVNALRYIYIVLLLNIFVYHVLISIYNHDFMFAADIARDW